MSMLARFFSKHIFLRTIVVFIFIVFSYSFSDVAHADFPKVSGSSAPSEVSSKDWFGVKQTETALKAFDNGEGIYDMGGQNWITSGEAGGTKHSLLDKLWGDNDVYAKNYNGVVVVYDTGSDDIPDWYLGTNVSDDYAIDVYVKDPGTGKYYRYDLDDYGGQSDAWEKDVINKIAANHGLKPKSGTDFYDDFAGALNPRSDYQTFLEKSKMVTDCNVALKQLKAQYPNLADQQVPAVAARIKELEKCIDENKTAATAVSNKISATQSQLSKPIPGLSYVGLAICVEIISDSFNPFGSTFGESIRDCAGGVANFLIEMVSWPFIVVVNVLDYATQFTIIDFASKIAKTSDPNSPSLYAPVYNVWQLIKNICNLFFITALVYIAIKTILVAEGFQEAKRLKNVIIFAVLINFSMFFTKFLIDVSNTATVQVFNAVLKSGSSQPQATNPADLAGKGIMQTPNEKKLLSVVFLNSMQVQKFVKAGDGGLTVGNYETTFIVSYALLSIVFILAATVILGAIAGTLITRFVIIIVLLMTSPIAYIGTFTPGLIAGYSKMWWEKLKDNLVYLPVLMIMFYITMNFAKFTADSVSKSPNNYYALVFSFIVTISMLVISLVVAKSVGGTSAGSRWGAKFAGALTFGLAARMGRRTFGAAGSALANSNALKRVATSNNIITRMTGASALARKTMKAGDKLQNATFDVRNTPVAKAAGLDGGIQEGYKKGIKEVAEQEAKERLEAAKKSYELSAKEKAKADARAELQDQSERADKRKKETDDAAKKAQEEVDELTKKAANVTGDIDDAILKEKQELSKMIAESEKEIVRVNDEIAKTIEAGGVKTADQQKKLDDSNAQKSRLEQKRNDTGNAADKADRIAKETVRLADKLQKATEGKEAIDKKVKQAIKDVEESQKRIKDRGFDPAKLKDQVGKDKTKAKKRKKDYLEYLEANSQSRFMDAEFITNLGADKHREELVKELKNLYKSKEDDEMKKLLDAIKERTKEEDKK
jgi:hypothetical protein